MGKRLHYDDILGSINNKDGLNIENYSLERLGTASYDLSLGTRFAVPKPWVISVSSAEEQEKYMYFVQVPNNNYGEDDNDLLINGKGILWDIRRFLFTLRRFFLVGVDKYGYFFRLFPFAFVLGELNERFELPRNMEAVLDGKSAGGRWGILIHATAGYADIGYKGKMTLEIRNLIHWFIKIYPGRRIGQIRLNQFDNEPSVCYGDEKITSHYQGDNTVKCSKGLKI